MTLLLDTSVLIDVLRDKGNRRVLLTDLVVAGHSLATTTMNFAEVYAGMRPEEGPRTEAFLGHLTCFPITVSIARIAGSLKRQWAGKGRTLALADMIIAASALEHGCTLMTDNRKHFTALKVPLYPQP